MKKYIFYTSSFSNRILCLKIISKNHSQKIFFKILFEFRCDNMAYFIFFSFFLYKAWIQYILKTKLHKHLQNALKYIFSHFLFFFIEKVYYVNQVLS